MSIANRFVSALLRSPLHRLLSGSTDVIRYRGRRSNRSISTPTQYVRDGDDIVILVARPETKTWWRNFRAGREVQVLLQGRWTSMTAQSVLGSEQPDRIGPLLDAYLSRFPKASRALGGGTNEDLVARAVVVHCRPR